MKYDSDFDSNPFGPHAIITRWVGAGSEVLDIGSGQGELANILKRVKGCKVTGVDRDSNFIPLSQSICDQFISADLEDPHVFEKIPGVYDFIIFADVLEHLVDPWTVLRKSIQKLKSQGRIIISIPNVAHYHLRLKLLRGNFEYQEEGHLDRTHLRFFTLTGIRDLVKSAGLRFVKREHTVWNPPTLGGNFVTVFLRWIEHELGHIFPNFFGYQFICLVEPTQH